jgi:hypothetical protein
MPLLVQWANDRTHELLGARRVTILKRNLELSLPASMSQGTTTPPPGTITAVRASTTITGDATAQAAWLTLPAHFPQGWFFRAKTAWYRIASHTPTTITLASPFAEDSIAATAYSLVQRHHQLPENLYQIEEDSFILSRTGTSLTFINPTTIIQMTAGSWPIAFGLPSYITEAESGPGDSKQLLIFPFSLKNEMLTYDAYMLKDDFSYQDQLPPGLEVHHLLPGLLADCLQWQSSADDLEPTTRQLLMNEKARQLTRWEGAKDAALMHLSTHQMRQITLPRPASSSTQHPRGMHTAYDYVWSRP